MDEELVNAFAQIFTVRFQLFCHTDLADEQLANYLYDLEAKPLNEQIIDFCPSGQPSDLIDFHALIKLEIPDIELIYP